MNAPEKPTLALPSASEYILDNFKATDRVAILVLNRQLGETTQRITTAQKASSPEFQAWLRYKNANGADIYMGMNALQHHASTRTKEDIEKISHVYLDIDHGGTASLEALENSDLVPRANYVLNTSPDKYQVVWKVEGMTIEEAEALNHAMVRQFDGDPAATDSTRVLRLPGFANKKYESDFYVQVRTESTQTYHLRDFKLHVDSPEGPRHQHQELAPKHSGQSSALSQSEHDWAYAKRALARGDDPEEVIRRIADYRANDKHDPQYYARHTVRNAQSELEKNNRVPNAVANEESEQSEHNICEGSFTKGRANCNLVLSSAKANGSTGKEKAWPVAVISLEGCFCEERSARSG